MTKSEFLRILREQLEGTLSQETIDGHIRYYDQYISDEIRMGKTEEQVMEELGSPVFIAKTLSDVAVSTGEQYYQQNGDYQDDSVFQEEEQEAGFHNKVHTFVLNTGLARFLVPLILFLLMIVFFFVVSTVAAIAFRFFFPILLVLFVFYLFRNFSGR